MNGFFAPVPSRQEMEIEAEFERAFFLLLHTQEVTSIDIDVSSIPESVALWRIEDLSDHFGLELEFHASGYVTVRRAETTGKVTSAPSLLGHVVEEANALKHWLGHEGSSVRRRLASWNIGRRTVAR